MRVTKGVSEGKDGGAGQPPDRFERVGSTQVGGENIGVFGGAKKPGLKSCVDGHGDRRRRQAELVVIHI